jgi:DNA-binding NarL/FixJ family response regulator
VPKFDAVTASGRLIGRAPESARLQAALDRAKTGEGGGLVLLAGEAGVGKTSLVESVAAGDEVLLLRGAAASGRPSPYGAIAAALRSHLRAEPEAYARLPLRTTLAVLLPELGRAAREHDRATLFEAVRQALAAAAESSAVLVALDDLQWSDDATLELLGALAPQLAELRLLAVAAYRSDEMPRGHALRRLRTELRRQGALEELTLEPFAREETSQLVEAVLGGPPSAALAAAVHDRTQGVPFFVEELTAALVDAGRVEGSDGTFSLVVDAELPLPDTIRDAVLLRIAGLSDDARASAEAAAVIGPTCDLEILSAVGCERGIPELLSSGLLSEPEPPCVSFRHTLAREAIYEDIPWLRRRDLHRRVAEELETTDAPRAAVAPHWVAAREPARARGALLVAAEELASMHAYRDAARAGRNAIELWPEGELVGERIGALEQLGRCAELAGELAEAARAWREVAALQRREHNGRALADAERRLANLYNLQGDRERALAARQVAAGLYDDLGLPAEAAIQRITVASYQQAGGDHAGALESAQLAGAEARRAERVDLEARALGAEGVARAKRGDFEAGLEAARRGLTLALDNEETTAAADVYQRLGTVLEVAGDYRGSYEALTDAVALCETDAMRGHEQTCLSCMAYVLREMGDWDEALRICDELDADPSSGMGTRVVTAGLIGAVQAFRGDLKAARRNAEECLSIAEKLNVVSMYVDSCGTLAWIDEQEGAHEEAKERCRLLLDRWGRSEDHHYAIWPLRSATRFLAAQGEDRDARACADALARIATDTGHATALSALAHALGETALLEGQTEIALEQLDRALELQERLDTPFERAQIELRIGEVLASAGERDRAVERIVSAHRTARRLAAKPLMAAAAKLLEELGEPLERRIGRRAAAEHEGAGLSRRELEVMRLVATGSTNREIADQLVLSPRTVDMHVRNILAKLDCRSRTEAASKAGTLGLLT